MIKLKIKVQLKFGKFLVLQQSMKEEGVDLCCRLRYKSSEEDDFRSDSSQMGYSLHPQGVSSANSEKTSQKRRITLQLNYI